MSKVERYAETLKYIGDGEYMADMGPDPDGDWVPFVVASHLTDEVARLRAIVERVAEADPDSRLGAVKIWDLPGRPGEAEGYTAEYIQGAARRVLGIAEPVTCTCSPGFLPGRYPIHADSCAISLAHPCPAGEAKP